MNFKINLIWIKNSFKLLVMNYYELILMILKIGKILIFNFLTENFKLLIIFIFHIYRN